MGKTFRQAYCEHFGCRPENFERHLMMRCIRPWRRPLAILVWAVHRESFDFEIETLRSIGDSDSIRSIMVSASELNHTRREMSFVRTGLGLRVSGRRLMHFASETMSHVPRETESHESSRT